VLGFVLNSNFTLTNVELFDFNNLTGEVSNPVMWNFIYGGQVYGLEFSPNGKFLYAANVDKIIQYDLTQTTAQGIQNSAFELSSFAPHGSLQLGIDNKIYVNSANFGLGIINCPNKQGNACNFNPNLFNGGQGLGLPKWVYYPDDPPYPVNNSILYTGTCLGTPTTFTLQSTVGINSLSWNFDDPNSADAPKVIRSLPMSFPSGEVIITRQQIADLYGVPVTSLPATIFFSGVSRSSNGTFINGKTRFETYTAGSEVRHAYRYEWRAADGN
jgi:hypothetical protein